MAKSRDVCLAMMAVLVALTAEASDVHLRGRILCVGLEMGEADYYRPGHWTPVVVELSNEGRDLFNGWIEIRQQDRDGDEIVARRHVSVQPAPVGTELRPDYLYIPAGVYESPRQFAVRVLEGEEGDNLAPLYDDQDERIDELVPPREIRSISGETRVILDLSDPRVVHLADSKSVDFLPEVHVLTGSPRELPDSVAGLDMVDAVVWDNAKPSVARDGLRDPAQLRALIEWVRRGGTLVLGLGGDLRIVQDKLGDILPVRLDAVEERVEVSNALDLPIELSQLLFDDRAANVPFDPPLKYVPITPGMRVSNDVSPVVPAHPELQDVWFVTRGPCGQGRVVVVAAGIRELLGGVHEEQKAKFFSRVLGIGSFEETEESGGSGGGFLDGEIDLFRHVEGMTGFQVTAGLYFLLAFAFVIAYIAVATAGSWTWLKRRGMLQHAWVAFALAAVVASGVSLAAVQVVRGFGRRVEECTVVDGRAGSAEAVATCYFGLRTGTHTSLDLSVPASWRDPDIAPPAPASLRPLSANPELFAQSMYAAAERYEAVPVLGELRSVPLRATLKQFEAVWSGTMDGQLSAELRRGECESGLDPGSWIQNELGTPLDSCYVIVADRDFREAGPARSKHIHVYPVGELADGENKRVGAVLAEEARKGAKNKGEDKGSPTMEELLEPAGPSKPGQAPGLGEMQAKWLKPLRRTGYGQSDGEEELVEIDADSFTRALLLLSTYEGIRRGQSVRRSQGQRLDCLSRLTTDTALFIGFSRDPGPARLCWRKPGAPGTGWKPIHPSRARVMYRIAIPIGPP